MCPSFVHFRTYKNDKSINLSPFQASSPDLLVVCFLIFHRKAALWQVPIFLRLKTPLLLHLHFLLCPLPWNCSASHLSGFSWLPPVLQLCLIYHRTNILLCTQKRATLLKYFQESDPFRSHLHCRIFFRTTYHQLLFFVNEEVIVVNLLSNQFYQARKSA